LVGEAKAELSLKLQLLMSVSIQNVSTLRDFAGNDHEARALKAWYPAGWP
jgi:hypothetical protein